MLGYIKKRLKGNKKVIIGYKFVKRYRWPELHYGPVFFCQSQELTPGKWERASYKSAYFISTKTGDTLHRHDEKYRAAIKKWLNGKLFPKSVAAVVTCNPEIAYEPGFHFFDSVRECKKARANAREDNCFTVIVECAFKEIVATGRQWGQNVKVARWQKILKEVR